MPPNQEDTVKVPESAREMSIYGYYKWPDLWVFVCPNCGSTGRRGSECQHDAPMAGGDGLIEREAIQVTAPPSESRASIIQEVREGLLSDEAVGAALNYTQLSSEVRRDPATKRNMHRAIEAALSTIGGES